MTDDVAALQARVAELETGLAECIAALDSDPDDLEPEQTGLGDFRWDQRFTAVIERARALLAAPAAARPGEGEHG